MIDTVLTHDDIIISSIKPKRQKIKPDSSISQLFYHFRNVTVFKKISILSHIFFPIASDVYLLIFVRKFKFNQVFFCFLNIEFEV